MDIVTQSRPACPTPRENREPQTIETVFRHGETTPDPGPRGAGSGIWTDRATSSPTAQIVDFRTLPVGNERLTHHSPGIYGETRKVFICQPCWRAKVGLKVPTFLLPAKGRGN